MFNWVVGIIAVLIALAFFWPQAKNTPQVEFDKLDQTTNQSQTIENARSNTFSRMTDSARRQQFKELDKFDRKIAHLLEEAQTLVDNLSYTLPEERNAIIVYNEVLDLSPNNYSAQQGIENISEKLLATGYRALANNTLVKANETLQKLVKINQESEQTIKLTSAISAWHDKKKILDLVDAGNVAFEKQDYIAPATKNALYFYEKAIEQDPSNKQAKIGIREIIKVYQQRIRNAIDAQQYSQASTNLEILIEIDVNDPKISDFQSEILNSLNSQQPSEEPNNTNEIN